jgi:hypothetical protein
MSYSHDRTRVRSRVATKKPIPNVQCYVQQAVGVRGTMGLQPAVPARSGALTAVPPRHRDVLLLQKQDALTIRQPTCNPLT